MYVFRSLLSKKHILYALFFCCVLFLLLIQTTEYTTAEDTEEGEEPFCTSVLIQEVKPLTSQTLTLQVSGYPTFGIGNDGTSLNTIVEDSFSLSSVIAYLYRSSLVIAGIVAFLSLLYGGILFILSGDSPDKRRRAVSRVQKVFFGAFILLTAVLTFEFIGLDINATRSLELEVETPEGGLELPGGSNTAFRVFKQRKQGHIYYGIPYTNTPGVQQTYSNLQPNTVLYNDCAYCDENTGSSCFFMCNQDNVKRTIEHREQQEGQGMVDITIPDSEDIYLKGRDRIKNCLQEKTDITSVIYAWDDDDTPVSCAAACMAISSDKGGSCGNTSDDDTKAFYEWLDDNDEYKDKIQQWGDTKFYELRGTRPSPSDSFFQDFVSKDRSGFRECIGNTYVIDAQDFEDFDICLCKNR